MINVTRTFLPPLEEYVRYLERIWQSSHVTNNGPLLKELEQKLKEFLGVRHLFLVANGTLGLQIALRALGITRQIITTPFSYVATTGAILWEKATPVFADVRRDDGCIDAAKVEPLVTESVEGILAVHVYGYPCNVRALKDIAQRRNLKIIYDAAHAFGSTLDGAALATHGDISVLSFHATKLFHCIEGGAVVTNDDEVARKIRLHRAFGHIGDEHFTVGINAKNSEFHAAMGLCVLPYVQDRIRQRREQSETYDRLLAHLPLSHPTSAMAGFGYNYAYYAVIFPSENVLLAAKSALEQARIGPRRYFYPSLNRLPYRLGESCPIAESMAERVMCLPLSEEVTPDVQATVARILEASLTG